MIRMPHCATPVPLDEGSCHLQLQLLLQFIRVRASRHQAHHGPQGLDGSHHGLLVPVELLDLQQTEAAQPCLRWCGAMHREAGV